MNVEIQPSRTETALRNRSMREFGESFIAALPRHIDSLQIPGRKMSADLGAPPRLARIDEVATIQEAMHEVLRHPTTRQAELHAENAFEAFLEKDELDTGLLKFFNGWYNTHKTTSLVSAKIIMRLSADAIAIPADQQPGYHLAMAHMHEVAKDDFGLGHKGHDGMYGYMTSVFDAAAWVDSRYEVPECNAFSAFLYEAGVAQHKSPLNSSQHNESILDAMMIAIASETWNGREFNFIGQHIEQKLLATNPDLHDDPAGLRNAKGYVMGHAGEVENKHGLHALAAAQAFSSTRGVPFHVDRLREVMLDYNARVGKAFGALHRSLRVGVAAH